MSEITREQKIEWLKAAAQNAFAGRWASADIIMAIMADYENGVVRDKCEFCLGTKGGVPGNENIVNGKVMCDYCHAMLPEKSPVRLDQAPALMAAIAASIVDNRSKWPEDPPSWTDCGCSGSRAEALADALIKAKGLE